MTDSALFTPLTIRGVEFRNRLWVSPMCQYSAEGEDGMPSAWHLVHLGSRAIGSGAVFVEATAVTPEGRISAWDLGIWDNDQAEAFSHINAYLHEMGTVTGIQLAHAGRKASTWREWSGPGQGSQTIADGGWQTVGPSAVPFTGYETPRELTPTELPGIVTAFVTAAKKALVAGFDVIELHAAHGYLLHQFLSPVANRRTDEYGGSLENRARLLLEVASAVRIAIGDEVPLLVRISATDWLEDTDRPAWDLEQSVTLAGWLKDAGVDLIDVSTGGIDAGIHVPAGPGYQVRFATEIRERAGIAVNAVGLITESAQAEALVAEGKADAVMVAREFLRDPQFALRAAHELGAEADWPEQYARGKWRGAPAATRATAAPAASGTVAPAGAAR